MDIIEKIKTDFPQVVFEEKIMLVPYTAANEATVRTKIENIGLVIEGTHEFEDGTTAFRVILLLQPVLLKAAFQSATTTDEKVAVIAKMLRLQDV